MEEYYVCVNNIHHYKKRPDGTWLHVCLPLQDFTEFHNSSDKSEEMFSYKAGDALINTVSEINITRENVPSTKDQFESALYDAMVTLDLFVTADELRE